MVNGLAAFPIEVTPPPLLGALPSPVAGAAQQHGRWVQVQYPEEEGKEEQQQHSGSAAGVGTGAEGEAGGAEAALSLFVGANSNPLSPKDLLPTPVAAPCLAAGGPPELDDAFLEALVLEGEGEYGGFGLGSPSIDFEAVDLMF